jgi:hypothetical protein
MSRAFVTWIGKTSLFPKDRTYKLINTITIHHFVALPVYISLVQGHRSEGGGGCRDSPASGSIVKTGGKINILNGKTV